jgi:hypothetical protein
VGQRQSFIKLLSLPFFADTPVGEDRAQSQNVQNKETLHDRIRDKRKSAQFAARRDQQYPRYITRFRVLVHSRNGPTRRNRAPRNRRRDRHHKACYCRTLMALDFVVRGLEAPDRETNRTPRHITLRGLTLRGLPRRFATDSGRVDALSRAEQRPAASQGGLICSDRKLGRPPTEVVRWLVPVAAVIGAGRGRVVVVLSEIAALGEARGRDQSDQRESSDKCLHDTSP